MVRSRSAPSHAAPAASPLLEAICPSWPPSSENSRFFSLRLIGVSRVTKRNPVPDHPGPPQEARSLHGVLAKAVAKLVHSRLEALVFRRRLGGEEVHLARAALDQARQPHAERADGQPPVALVQELERRLVDLVAGRDRQRLLGLPREMPRLRPVHYPQPRLSSRSARPPGVAARPCRRGASAALRGLFATPSPARGRESGCSSYARRARNRRPRSRAAACSSPWPLPRACPRYAAVGSWRAETESVS